MKVLIVAGGSELGGAPKSMIDMVRIIKGNYGVEYIILLNKEGRLAQFCRDAGIEYCIDGHEGIAMSRGSTSIRRFAKFLLKPWFAFKSSKGNRNALKIIEKKIDMNSIDLIHTNSNRDGIGALLARKYGINHVWHLREFGKEDYDTFFLPPYNVEFMDANANKFIVISDALRKAWIEKGISESKCVQIYNGINVNAIQSNTDRSSFQDGKVRMVFTGTICPSKGQLEIIEAIGLLDEEYRTQIELDFIGEGPSDYTKTLKNRIKELGIERSIRFCGFCNNVGEELQKYNVGIVCSRAEAFGRITPEYMAAGLIVIASDTGANPELIEDGKNGFLYHLHNFESLTYIIKRICDMPVNNKIKISKYAEKYARYNFTAEINAENVFKLYKEIMEMKK